MALVLANRVQETTTTTGTGTITLAGAVSGFQSFAAIGNANTTYYTITSGTAWEVGIGTYTSAGTTLARTTILASSAAGAAITLAGTSVVFATYPAEKSVNYDASNNVGIGTTGPQGKLHVSGTGFIFNSANADPAGGVSIPNLAGTFLTYNRSAGLVDTEIIYGNTANSFFRLTSQSAAGALTERMRVNSSGEVFVGKTAASVGTDGAQFIPSGFSAFSAPGTTALFLNRNTNDGTILEFGRNGVSAATMGLTSSALTIGTAGSERMRITSAGLVGIGTTSPDRILTIGNAGVLGLNNSGNTLQSTLQHAAGGLDIYAGGASYVAFGTNSSERMRVTSTGNVLIGTTTTQGKFTVASATGNTGFNYGTISSPERANLYYDTDGTGWKFNIGKVQSTAFTAQMTFVDSGNIGIGTTTPSQALMVSGGSTTTIGVASTGANSLLRGFAVVSGSTEYATFKQRFDTGEVQITAGIAGWGGLTTFHTNGVERMRISSGGDLSLGTTTAYTRLTVSNGASTRSGITISDTNTASLMLFAGNSGGAVISTDTGFQDLIFKRNSTVGTENGTETMRINSSGNVGVGTSTIGVKLEVNGATRVVSGVAGGYYGFNYSTASVDSRSWSIYNDHTAYGDLNILTSSTQTGAPNTSRFYISAAGNIGVGTTSPARPLHVYYNSAVVGAYTMVLQSTVGGYGAGVSFQSQITGGAVAEMARITADGESSWNTTASTQDAGLRFYTALDGAVAEKMRIDSAGSVGIGTTSPSLRFVVSNAGAAGLEISPTALASSPLIQSFNRSGAAYTQLGFNALYYVFQTSGTETMRTDTGGNLGIGVSTPGARLDVTGAVNSLQARFGNVAGRGLEISTALVSGTNDAGSILNAKGSASGTLIFQTDSGERFRITSTGGITSSDLADAVGYKGLPQNSQTASYTLALTDMGKHISITTGGVVIPANGSVAFPIGSAISIFNNSGSNQTISITTDTLRLAGTATTGSRTLAQYGVATCLKVTATVWVISGAGVT
jgi:hypothetical protein